jgi:hypothetical protein
MHAAGAARAPALAAHLFLFFIPNVLSSIFLAAACARAFSSLADLGAIGTAARKLLRQTYRARARRMGTS